ncbi:MAG: serine/threonine protein kinase [Deltaproteobacteria bacterium]|nr:serine/threonine protein kinase [Deltaproteobacteria bacterium]
MTGTGTTAPPSTAQLVFGKYEVLRRLAIGGMGEVFLARQVGVPGFERRAILKNLLPELAVQRDFVDQFLDEARVIATLNHPNIVGVYEVGEWQGVYFIAMEYIHGVDLAGLVRAAAMKDTRVPVPVAARIIRDAASGLDHAHRATDVQGHPLRIVHRDISPQNIMVREDGVTKVVDFGIAKASNKSSRTRTGAVKGKIQYMPPEQLLGEPLDGRADQFALGVVFWELCSGQRLFKADTEMQVFELILKKPYPRLEDVVDVPRDVAAVVARMLARDPTDRFPSCAEVGSELGSYLAVLSSEVGEPRVADTVRALVGKELEARLTQSNAFATGIGLAGALSPPTPIHTDQMLPTVRGRAPVSAQTGMGTPWKAGAAGVAAALVLGGLAWALIPRDSMPAAPPVAPPAPTGAAGATDPVPPPARAPPVVRVESTPPNAAVWLGREAMGTTPVTFRELRPDVEYLLTVELRGYRPEELRVKAGPGEEVTHNVVLRPLEKKPPRDRPPPTQPEVRAPAMGQLSLRTTPWARLYVDGKAAGQTPVYRLPLTAGKHQLRLVNEPLGIDVTRDVVIPGNGEFSDTWKLK